MCDGAQCASYQRPPDRRNKFRRFTWELDRSRDMPFEDYAPEMARFLGYSSGSNSHAAAE